MKRWVQVVLILLGIAIFIYILWQSGPDGVAAVLAGDWRYLLLALLATGLAQMISGWRLQVALAAVTGLDDVAARRRWPWRATYHVTLTAQLMGMVVPRLLSTFGGKAAALKAYQTDLRESVPAVLLDNIFDILVMAPLMAPGFLFATGVLNVFGLYAGYGAILLLLLPLLSWRPAEAVWLPRLAYLERVPWLGSRLHVLLARLLIVWPPAAAGRRLLLLTVLLNGFLALRFYFISLALGLVTTATLFLALYPMAQLSLIIALAPGGLGVFDLSWLGLLSLAAVSGAEHFAVAQRIYVTVINLFWGGVAILLALTLGRPAGAAPDSLTPSSRNSQ
ncbi:MAG: flippase-like domain-containing protein, partial [Anaerolineales bacterium]|nr:flippase-like domain-containing protein [Anaerolineales bacterium]